MPNPVIIRRGGGAWTPKRLPGLVQWLRADTGLYQDSAFTTLAAADADPVGGWRDQSGQGNDVIQATSSKRGTLKLAILNGLPVVRFDTTDDLLRSTNTAPTNMTVLCVVRCTTQDTGTHVLWQVGKVALAVAPTGTAQLQLDDSGVAVILGYAFSGVGTAAFHVHAETAVVSGNVTGTMYLDGVSQAGPTAHAQNSTNTGFTVGNLQAGTLPFGGDVAEVIVCNAALAAGDLSRATRYLGARYALAVA